jgi:hypothetical protein
VPSTAGSEAVEKWILRKRSAWFVRATAARSASDRLVSPVRVSDTSRVPTKLLRQYRGATFGVRSFPLGGGAPRQVPCCERIRRFRSFRRVAGSRTIFMRSAMVPRAPSGFCYCAEAAGGRHVAPGR